MNSIQRIVTCFIAYSVFGTALQAQEAASVSGATHADKSSMQLAIASTRPSESLEPYTGVYVTSAGVELIVVTDDRSLTIERADGTETPVHLVPESERGSFTSGSLRIVFERGDEGEVTGLRVSVLGAFGVTAEKAPPRRGIVIIEDVIEKAEEELPPSVLPELPLPGDLPSWTIPFAVL